MISSEKIYDILRSEKKKLQGNGIIEMGLFGSYVRGDATENSDIDILIELSDDSPMTLFSLTELEQSLSSRFNKKVDLVLKRDLKPGIGKRILSEVRYV
jgi:predicted nucleotidyltransferase